MAQVRASRAVLPRRPGVGDPEAARRWTLPATATAEAASTVVTSAAVEVPSFVAASFVPASKFSSIATASLVATAEAITIVPASKGAIPTTIEIATAIKPRASVEARASIKSMEPRAGANKNSAGEITRPVVAVRRAGVGIVSVVAVRAHWRRTNVGRANANADHNSLCVCVRRCN
jgi:hypothetical protein